MHLLLLPTLAFGALLVGGLPTPPNSATTDCAWRGARAPGHPWAAPCLSNVQIAVPRPGQDAQFLPVRIDCPQAFDGTTFVDARAPDEGAE